MTRQATIDHHEYGPSNYPAWEICPHYEGGEAGEDADIGTAAHDLLYRAFTGAIEINDDLAVIDEDKSLVYPVRRAYNGIRALVSELLNGREADDWYYEVTLKSNTPDLPEKPFGTADVVVRKRDTVIVSDYKHRFSDRDYTAQLAAYAAFFAEELPEIHEAILVVWYGDTGTYTVRHLGIEECRAMAIEACNKRRNRAASACHANPWCSLCKHCGKCNESTALTTKMSKAFPEELAIPADRIADMLVICSELDKRIKAFREYAKTYALENGGIVNKDGELAYTATSSTRREIDIPSVFDRIKEHISPTQLIESCTLSQKALKALLKPFYKTSEIDTIISECSTDGEQTVKLTRVSR